MAYRVSEVIDLILKEVPGAPLAETVDTLKSGDGDPHAQTLLQLILAVDADSEPLRQAGNFAQQMMMNQQVNALGWLGRWVTLYAEDDPFWGPFVLEYFDAMRRDGHMEALAYAIRQAAGDPEARRWRAANAPKLVAFHRSSERWAVDRRSESTETSAVR